MEMKFVWLVDEITKVRQLSESLLMNNIEILGDGRFKDILECIVKKGDNFCFEFGLPTTISKALPDDYNKAPGSFSRAYTRYKNKDSKTHTRYKNIEKKEIDESYIPYLLPVYFTILQCYTDLADKVQKGIGTIIRNIFKPNLKNALEEYFVDELGQSKDDFDRIFEDEDLLLPLLMTVFFYESFESKEEIAAKFNAWYAETVFKERYFDHLRLLMNKNEIKEDGVRLKDYYALPIIKPKLCSNTEPDHPFIKTKIVCGAGCGKTSAMRALIAACIYDEENIDLHDKIEQEWMSGKEKPKDFFPIYIEASNINVYVNHRKKAPDSLLDLVFCEINKGIEDYEKEHTDVLKVIKKQFNRNEDKVLLLIDGLDEVNKKYRNNLTSLIKGFTEKHSKASLIITSRQIDFKSYSYGENNDPTDIITSLPKTVLSLNPAVKTEIIKKWALIKDSRVTDARAHELQKFIDDNEYLSKLSDNPYLLSLMICEIFNGLKTPYRIINELTQKLIDKKLEPMSFDFKSLVRPALGHIAYEMILRDIKYILRDELEKKYDAVAKRDKRIDRSEWYKNISDINTLAGLIIFDDDKYSFQYDIIEKFLAAENRFTIIQDNIEDHFGFYALPNDTLDLTGTEIEENTREVLLELWKCFKDRPELWGDLVSMMIVESKNPEDEGQLYPYIAPIFCSLITLSKAKSTEKEMVKQICKVFRIMCLEEYSLNEITKNPDVSKEDRKALLNVLYANRELFKDVENDFEKCRNGWRNHWNVLESKQEWKERSDEWNKVIDEVAEKKLTMSK